MAEIELLANLIVAAKKIVVFTGAGISTESGIPDFRSPGGIWDRFDPDDFTYQKFVSSLETRRKQWQLLSLGAVIANIEPNPAHYAIAELYRLGKLDCVITQNIDNLHRKAGVPEDRIFELHGNMQWARCLNCHQRFPMEEILPRIKEGIEVPECPNCRGMLKPDAVFFGEQLPQRTLIEATHRSQNCDLFIVVGSTLVVYPAAYMPVYAKEAGAKIAIVNLTPTDLDQYATVVIHSKAGETLQKVMQKVHGKLTQYRN